MKTSQSVESLLYGWSWSDDIIPAFVAYAPYRSSSPTHGYRYAVLHGNDPDLERSDHGNKRQPPHGFSGGQRRRWHHGPFCGSHRLPGFAFAAVRLLRHLGQQRPLVQFPSELSSSYIFGVWGGMAFLLSAAEPTPSRIPILWKPRGLLWQKNIQRQGRLVENRHHGKNLQHHPGQRLGLCL